MINNFGYMRVKKKLRLVELYAGTGRVFEPFRRWRNVELGLMVDNSEYASKVYKHNFPKAPYLSADLSRLSSSDLQRHAGGKVDILIGCPPCQGFSDGGARNPFDSRNSHISKFMGYVRDLAPVAVALENVPLAGASGRFDKLTNSLEELGYVWTATIANSALWGSCQSRQRLLLVAIKKSISKELKLPRSVHGSGKYFSYSLQKSCELEHDIRGLLGITPASKRVARLLPEYTLESWGKKAIPTVGEIFDGLPKVDSRQGRKLGHFTWAHSKEVLRRMEKVGEGERWRGGDEHYSQTYGRLHRKGFSKTITTFFPNAGSGRFWHPTQNRAISLREAARIQGFPDSFQFLDLNSRNCTLVGNALDASLANLSYRILRENIES